ncbi:MAG TPA: N,N-dimethylformamidase beta subunit family domain-containing protein, partial [Chloroflexota bacterium]|nr:N,N-dimethylformamidase beta subunit family domain-containing protein [Chloroflexota bacterium]
FVVRDDGRTASLLYQNSVNTYEAYNNWGGYSLYSYNSSGGNRAYKVSFDRPYRADGSGDYFGWEVYFVQWAEQQGFDLTYSTDLDTALNPARLQSVKGVLVVGHDEYWTKAMYDAVQNARDAGVSLGFFGANATYWQARYEASLSGVANRVLVSYKTSDIPNSTDPLTATNPALTTDLWRNPLPNRPEQSLIGVMYTSETGNNWDATVPDVVINSANPTYTGTDFVDGSRVPGIVGYEADRSWTTFALPANQSYALLSNSPYTNVAGASDYSNSVVYQALSGAWVFGAGSMGWSYALARPGYLNLGIQQTTLNVLNRFISNVPVPVTATPTVTPVPTPTALPSAYRDAVVADQPLSYWRLDESGGSSAGDWQHLNNGAYVGAPSLGQPGALAGDPDTAVLFNGTSQYVSVPYNASLNPAAFSVEVWAKPAGGAGTYRGVVASRSYPTGWVLYAGADNTWQFWVNNGTGMLSVPGGPVSLNVWSQLVGTFDGTTARLYVNGVLVSSGTVASYQPQASRPLVVGQSEPGSGFFFPGVVDEPAVYPTALTASQVQHHYLIGAVGVTPTATPTPAPTGTPGATDTPTATGTATASPTIAVTATPTQTPAASATPTPSPSPVVTSTPSITPTLAPPPAPTRLRARAAGTSRRPKVDLSWQSSGAGLTSIAVERSPDQNTWTVIANLPGAAVSYTDATVASQATYFYRIRAINAAGASPYSRPASVTTT